MKRIGVALGASESWAVPLTAIGYRLSAIGQRITDNGQRISLPGAGADGSGVAAVVAALRGALVGRARLHVVLLPDLCQVRRIALPRMRDDERRDVLRRTLYRHFLRSGTPHAFGAERCEGGVVAAAAPLALVEALERAVAAAGWRLAAIHPAEAAWAAATEAAAPGASRALVPLPDRVELLHVDRGRLVGMRRLPGRLDGPERTGRLIEEGGPGVEPPHSLGPEGEALAAAFAHRARGPEIVSEATWDARRRTVRRAGRQLVAAAAALLVLAAGVEWWGAKRELAALRAERANHAAEVAQALERRERVTMLTERYAVLSPGARGGPEWTQVVASVAEHLPPTAYLTAFRAAGDSLVLEGVAREAGPVLDALRAAPPIAALRATAPIRRETKAGGEAVERFALAARLSSGREQP